MINMQSLNTSSMSNKYCQAMSKKGDKVCSSCYSNRLLKMYKTAEEAFDDNGDILGLTCLPEKLLPKINASKFRFNAYGELINIYHLMNLINITKNNPATTFSLWTKREDLVFKYFRDFPMIKKPKNLILIYSGENLNERVKLPKYFDKVFTVWSKEHKDKKFINCGTRTCFDCSKCYDTKDRTKFINEVLK